MVDRDPAHHMALLSGRSRLARDRNGNLLGLILLVLLVLSITLFAIQYSAIGAFRQGRVALLQEEGFHRSRGLLELMVSRWKKEVSYGATGALSGPSSGSETGVWESRPYCLGWERDPHDLTSLTARMALWIRWTSDRPARTHRFDLTVRYPTTLEPRVVQLRGFSVDPIDPSDPGQRDLSFHSPAPPRVDRLRREAVVELADGVFAGAGSNPDVAWAGLGAALSGAAVDDVARYLGDLEDLPAATDGTARLQAARDLSVRAKALPAPVRRLWEDQARYLVAGEIDAAITRGSEADPVTARREALALLDKVLSDLPECCGAPRAAWRAARLMMKQAVAGGGTSVPGTRRTARTYLERTTSVRPRDPIHRRTDIRREELPEHFEDIWTARVAFAVQIRKVKTAGGGGGGSAGGGLAGPGGPGTTPPQSPTISKTTGAQIFGGAQNSGGAQGGAGGDSEPIYLIASTRYDGSRPRILLESSRPVFPVGWSQDGGDLVIAGGTNPVQGHFLPVDGTELRRFPQPHEVRPCGTGEDPLPRFWYNLWEANPGGSGPYITVTGFSGALPLLSVPGSAALGNHAIGGGCRVVVTSFPDFRLFWGWSPGAALDSPVAAADPVGVRYARALVTTGGQESRLDVQLHALADPATAPETDLLRLSVPPGVRPFGICWMPRGGAALVAVAQIDVSSSKTSSPENRVHFLDPTGAAAPASAPLPPELTALYNSRSATYLEADSNWVRLLDGQLVTHPAGYVIGGDTAIHFVPVPGSGGATARWPTLAPAPLSGVRHIQVPPGGGIAFFEARAIEGFESILAMDIPGGTARVLAGPGGPFRLGLYFRRPVVSPLPEETGP